MATVNRENEFTVQNGDPSNDANVDAKQGTMSNADPRENISLFTRIWSQETLSWAYEGRIIVAVSLINALSGVIIISMAFTFFIPQFRCTPFSFYNNKSMSNINTSSSDIEFTNRSLVNFCGAKQNECKSFTFEQNVMKNSLMSQHSLVCDRSGWKYYFLQVFFVGYILGTLSIGFISDRFGRKTASIIGLSVMTVGLILGSVAMLPSYDNENSPDTPVINRISISRAAVPYLELMNKLACGYGIMATITPFYVWMLELVGVRHRLFVCTLTFYAFAVAHMAAACLAWLWPEWRMLHALALLLLASFWIMMLGLPESFLWHINKGRGDCALDTLHRIDQLKTTGNYRHSIKTQLDEFILEQNTASHGNDSASSLSNKENLLHVYRHCSLAVRHLLICVFWFGTTCMFYGLILYTSNLAGSLFLNVFLNGLVSLPGYIFSHVGAVRLGQRVTALISLFSAAAACIVASLVCGLVPLPFSSSANLVLVVCTLVAKLFICSAFNLCYAWTSQIMPTSVRNAAMTTGSFCGRLGALLAPAINELANANQNKIGSRNLRDSAAPIAIFAVITLITAIGSIWLPDNRNRTRISQNIREELEQTRRAATAKKTFAIKLFELNDNSK